MIPPEPGAATARAGSGWRRPRVESAGIQRYIETIRERLGLVLLTVLTTMAMAVLYLAVADKVYEADADLLVTPVSADDPLLTGLGLIRESSDPTRDVETVARLVVSRNVASLVKEKLNLPGDPDDIAKKVEAAPVAQSNIVAITASDNDPKLARDLANGFANGVVEERSAELRTQLEPLIERTRERIRAGEETTFAGQSGTLADQLDQLERLEVGGDPSIRVSTTAIEPDSAVSPRPAVTLFVSFFGGLVLGIGGAFAIQALDPRLRREEQLRELFSLPVLARIPKERQAPDRGPRQRFVDARETVARAILGARAKRPKRTPLAPSDLSPRTVEAFRTLRTVLTIGGESEGSGGRAILVTGASPSEGKTTTAVNLASSLALGGNSVILIEADFHHPNVGRSLRVRARVGIDKVLLGEVALEDAVVAARPFGESLRVLPAVRSDDRLTELLTPPVVRKLLDQARGLADYVVLDSPPLTEVVDALPLARHVDDVLLVCRLGSTNLDRLTRLGDLLEQNEVEPTGFVVVGAGSADEESYYMTARRESGVEPDAVGSGGNGRGSRASRQPTAKS